MERALPVRLDIGPVRVEPPVLLAPMEGVTDRPFRRMVRRIGGVGMTCTEFVASEGLRRGVGKMVEMARLDPDERPASVQIYGRNPEGMARAARIVEELGASVVDINMGCPSRRVCAHSGGAALLDDPALAAAIVRAVVRAVSVPVTVKMRTGTTRDRITAPEIARAVEAEGAAAITVHWRTREEGYSGTPVLERIAAVREAVRIPVVGNGDVVDVESAERMFRETGCDAVMIGRGAMRDPWLPLQVARHLAGLPPVRVTGRMRRDALFAYIDDMLAEVRNPRYALGRAKQVARYLTHGLPWGSAARTRLLRARDLEEYRAVAEAYLAWLDAPDGPPPAGIAELRAAD